MNKPLKLIQLSASTILVCILFCLGCIKAGGRCEMADDVRNSAWAFSFKDNAIGKYLYREFSPLYKIDSLKVYDENNQQLIVNKSLDNIPDSASRYYKVSFWKPYNQQTDAGAFNGEVCRNFIIKYAYNEADTIKACFKAKETKCGSVFEYLNIFYKGELVGSVSNNVAINLTINKK